MSDCENHPGTEATHEVSLDAALKQPDGTYLIWHQVCEACADLLMENGAGKGVRVPVRVRDADSAQNADAPETRTRTIAETVNCGQEWKLTVEERYVGPETDDSREGIMLVTDGYWKAVEFELTRDGYLLVRTSDPLIARHAFVEAIYRI